MKRRFEEKRIQKEYMNNSNRAINFEIANMGKIIKTSSEQLVLFEKLRKEEQEQKERTKNNTSKFN